MRSSCAPSRPIRLPPQALTDPHLLRHDTELTDLIPFLTDLKRVDDIRSVLDAGLYQHWS